MRARCAQGAPPSNMCECVCARESDKCGSFSDPSQGWRAATPTHSFTARGIHHGGKDDGGINSKPGNWRRGLKGGEWVGGCAYVAGRSTTSMSAIQGVVHVRKRYTVKKRLAVFPSPAEMSLTKLSLVWNNLIITGQGEFGK